jgi:DNA (cytosine-5)-methyltransferase 1
MVNYNCENCCKVFQQKSHFDKHKNRKSPCKKNTTIEEIIENKVKEVLANINPQFIIPKSNQEENITEENITEENITEENITEENITEENITEENITEDVIIKKRILSLFAGCGGLDSGFIKNGKYTHVLVNDFDKDACQTYELNFHIKPNCGDVKKLTEIPDFDLLMGGFPCQGFSMANPYRNEKDKRNELYLEILRILKLKKPKYFILENVKGLLNMGGYATPQDKKDRQGKIMKIILDDLKNCGYKVQFKLFEIKLYDVPQKRERVIIIGVRDDIDFTPQWPKASDKIITLQQAIGDLSIEYNPDIQHVGTKHKCAVTGYLGNRELKWDEPSPTITGRGGGSGGPVIHNHPSLKRRLTVRECARIQTFPDDFKFVGSISSMYKQLGNAVPYKFSEHLATIFQDAP